MRKWAKLPLPEKATLLASFCRLFRESPFYEKSVRIFEREVFRSRHCQVVIENPLTALTKDALLAYTKKDAVLRHPKKVLLLLGGKIPTPFLFTLFQGLMGNVAFTVKPSSLDPFFPLLLQDAFRALLPSYRLWQVKSERGEKLLQQPLASNGIIIYGSNRALSLWQNRARKEKKPFLGYGERISGGIILPQKSLPYEKLAEDILLYHQEGCFSPHFFFTIGKNGKKFAQNLFGALKASLKIFPSPRLNKREKSQLFFTLQHYRALSALKKEIALFLDRKVRLFLLPSSIKPRFIGLQTVYVYEASSLQNAEKLCNRLSTPISTLVVYPKELKKKTAHLAFRSVSPGNAQQNSVSDLHENRAWIREMFCER